MNKMCISTFETKMFVKSYMLLFEKFEHVIWNKFRDRREGEVNKNWNSDILNNDSRTNDLFKKIDLKLYKTVQN